MDATACCRVDRPVANSSFVEDIVNKLNFKTIITAKVIKLK